MTAINNILNNKRGFTVIELLVAIVIMGAVLAIATTMIVQSFNVFRSSTYRMSAGQMAEMTLRQIALHVRAAESEPVENDNYIFLHPDYEEIIIEHVDDNLRLITKNGDENLVISAHSVTNFMLETIDGSDNEFRLEITYIDEEEGEKSKSTRVKSRNI